MSGGRLSIIILAAATVLGTVVVSPRESETTRQETREIAAGSGDVSGPTTRRVQVGGGPSGSGRGVASGNCNARDNGGATAPGVTATSIRLASTVVQSGIGASFLSSSPIGMRAVINRVNKEGGICGRFLELTTINDGWDQQRGLTFIRNFIQQDYFALPVVPSSEGLTAAISSGDISKAGIPVVGSDGMLIQQYQNPWVWPVATATVSTMRIMTKYARAQGAKTFGLVYDEFYKFGREGADAWKAYVRKLTGKAPKAFVGIQPGQSSYGSDIQEFNSACNNQCDFVALLLEPGTAETWIAGRPQFGRTMTAGAQTLFNERFAKNCGVDCADMLVWTGYNPPIDQLASLPGVRQFTRDVKSVSPTVDVTNQFLEGAYLGMSVFVEALRRVGPNLTRERLKQELDAMTYSSDLASALTWRPGRHHSNTRAQAFRIIVAAGSFAGFRNARTGWVTDPDL